MEKKMEFPKKFDVCPACGSKERIGDNLIEGMKEDGSVPKGSFENQTAFAVHQLPIIDPNHRPTGLLIGGQASVKVAMVYWDVCAECGTIYCTEFAVLDGQAFNPVQAQAQRSGFGMPGAGAPPFQQFG